MIDSELCIFSQLDCFRSSQLSVLAPTTALDQPMTSPSAATNAPRKRRSVDDEDELSERLRPSTRVPSTHQSETTLAAPIARQNPLQLRAYGLEDRADAVISMGAAGWSLSNLSQWRQDMLQPQEVSPPATPGNNKQSREFIAQRQREYKQQMLRMRTRGPSC